MTVTIIANGQLQLVIGDAEGKVQQAAVAEFQEAIELNRVKIRRTVTGLSIVIEAPKVAGEEEVTIDLRRN